MVSVSDLIKDVADVTGERPEAVNAYARALIDAGLLPKSRGRAIAHIDLVHVIRLVAAIALEPKIKDTAEIVSSHLGQTNAIAPESAPPSLQTTAEQALIDWLRILFVDPTSEKDKSHRVQVRGSEIFFVRSWRVTGIRATRADGNTTTTLFAKGSDHPPRWHGHVKRETAISGAAFAMLGLKSGRDYVGAIGGGS